MILNVKGIVMVRVGVRVRVRNNMRVRNSNSAIPSLLLNLSLCDVRDRFALLQPPQHQSYMA